ARLPEDSPATACLHWFFFFFFFLRFSLTKENRRGERTIDFQDPTALRELTKALLNSWFKLSIDIPPDTLIPPVGRPPGAPQERFFYKLTACCNCLTLLRPGPKPISIH
ncbi:MAG: hypothetical protein BJ554DRAFT_4954, partial [Olpidium bornovanus]